MGAWDVGPFDNDHAADFASSVQLASSPEARQDLFSITFGAFMDMPDVHPELITMEDGYELPSIIEEVIASAAWVADTAIGDTGWINTPYARGVDRNTEELNPHPEIGEVSGHMIVNAHAALAKALRLMRRANIGSAWCDPAEHITIQLRGAMG